MPASTPLLDRFEAKYIPDPSSGCWLWTACLNGDGYAIIRNGHMRQAHIVSYELHRGAVLEGLELDHLCRIRHCVNPYHLEPMTHLENMRRGTSSIALALRTNTCKHGHDLADAYSRPKAGPNGRRCRECVCRQNKMQAEKRKSRL